MLSGLSVDLARGPPREGKNYLYFNLLVEPSDEFPEDCNPRFMGNKFKKMFSDAMGGTAKSRF